MYMPISGEHVAILPLIMIGFFVGVCGGFFGISGSFMVTPALNIFGFPMAYAVATDMAHTIGKSIMSTFRHWKFGHVDVALALLMILGTLVGVEGGARSVVWLLERGLEGTVIRYVYIALLGSLGSYMLWQYYDAQKKNKQMLRQDIVIKDFAGNKLTKFLQGLKIPPVVHLRTSGITISLWVIIVVGLVTGYLAGFLGVGGGFIRVPALLYIIGCPMKLAVGTDLMEIIISSSYGGFTYALKGLVDLHGAMIMLLGAALGAQFGTIATRYVFGIRIRLYFAITIFGSAFGVVAKQISEVKGAALRAAVNAQLAAQGMTGDQISQFIANKTIMAQFMASHPELAALQQAEILWNNIGGVLMVGLSGGISLIIMLQCVEGIVREKREGVITGA